MRQSNNKILQNDSEALKAFKERLVRLVNEKFDGKHTRLARISGVGASTIQGWMDKDTVNPNGLALHKIALAGGVSVAWLFGDEEAPSQESAFATQDVICLPKGDNEKLSDGERATLEQALEVLRATGEAGAGYAKTLYQNIEMFHRGVRDARAINQSPSRRAAEEGSRAKRKKR